MHIDSVLNLLAVMITPIKVDFSKFMPKFSACQWVTCPALLSKNS